MMTDADDPLADTEPEPCQYGCAEKWVTIAVAEDGSYLGPNPADPAYAEMVASTATYPCPTCAPELYLQWKNGCFKREHRPCERCSYRRSNRRHD